MNPLRKPKNEETPLSGVLSLSKQHYETKDHKAWLLSAINLVKLKDFVPLWQKRLFGVGSLLICDESALVESSNANHLNLCNFHQVIALD